MFEDAVGRLWGGCLKGFGSSILRVERRGGCEGWVRLVDFYFADEVVEVEVALSADGFDLVRRALRVR